MYLRLAFWTLSMAYTSALFSRGTSGASPGIMLSAAGSERYSASAWVACSSAGVRASAAEPFSVATMNSKTVQGFDPLGFHALVGAACREVLVFLRPAVGPVDYQAINPVALAQTKSEGKFGLRQIT